jgi:hypothetical protein
MPVKLHPLIKWVGVRVIGSLGSLEEGGEMKIDLISLGYIMNYLYVNKDSLIDL